VTWHGLWVAPQQAPSVRGTSRWKASAEARSAGPYRIASDAGFRIRAVALSSPKIPQSKTATKIFSGHVFRQLSARWCSAHGWRCRTLRRASNCRGSGRHGCRGCVAEARSAFHRSRWERLQCEHGRSSGCKECGGRALCVHGRRKHQCRECGGSGICAHGRRKSRCNERGGSRSGKAPDGLGS
jgi:hypothetical protein